MNSIKTLFQILFVICGLVSLVRLQTAQQIRSKFNATDFKFNLAGSRPNVMSDGGTGRRASIAEMPSLKGVGVSNVLFHVEPCGINLPHVHPRGTEIFYVVEGSFQTGFLEENDARLILNNLTQGETTFFPQGLIHFEQNLGCTNATFLSAFNHEDPGVLTITNRLFDIPTQALTSSFNTDEATIQNIKSKLSFNPAKGVGECRKRCGFE
jgi:oxalate decarboxylase/phosphoglucose isomerase-like protein (cupin superfamily)